jgi:hypothetical protein
MSAALDADPGESTFDTPVWVPLAEAADHLGLSRDALRRRIRRGTIPSRKIETRYGLTYEVQLGEAPATLTDADRHSNGHQSGASATVTPASLAAFATLVRDITERSERNAAAAAMWQARAEFLASQLEQAQLALAAPKEPSDNDAVETPQRPAMSSWRRWWHALAGG